MKCLSSLVLYDLEQEQYKFLHDATIEALMCTSSDPSSAEFPQIYEDLLKVDAETGKRNIDLNFEVSNIFQTERLKNA